LVSDPKQITLGIGGDGKLEFVRKYDIEATAQKQ
jgi:hypothetical protein